MSLLLTPTSLFDSKNVLSSSSSSRTELLPPKWTGCPRATLLVAASRARLRPRLGSTAMRQFCARSFTAAPRTLARPLAAASRLSRPTSPCGGTLRLYSFHGMRLPYGCVSARLSEHFPFRVGVSTLYPASPCDGVSRLRPTSPYTPGSNASGSAAAAFSAPLAGSTPTVLSASAGAVSTNGCTHPYSCASRPESSTSPVAALSAMPASPKGSGSS